ncbi:MAG: hypothetical protein LVQ97_03240 [Candidatus Micrarchaeales archaeon]|jgi:hypothetical protein|uniref:Uncharacterized protein n=1 Tax=Candidatus Micrarchaeum acidiphilum ARMAN-2 TaxID=425595 RepID=C7DG87_MICA2|nr:MAG: hypothetical protein UNLARM2_0091 [Candidatus Micrarchaeum acidiphilum ARMAN-2]MCW6161174.1 hypothetical protein [Candidatus Micrarchaeales archaeon]
MVFRNLDFGGDVAGFVKHVLLPLGAIAVVAASGISFGGSAQYGIIGELAYVKNVLAQVGPALSAMLFVVAGIFYAVGQMLPPDKRANFHTTAINIIIGAVVVGVLSFASSSLAVASTHLLSNVTSNVTA